MQPVDGVLGRRGLPAERTEADAPQPRMIVVQNWFEELRRLVPTN